MSEKMIDILETERLGMKSCGSHTVVYRGKEMPHIIFKLENPK